MANHKPIRTAFWNVQNLFDTTASEIATDLDFTRTNGWTGSVFDKKLDALATVLNAMFDDEGPDLLGLCEVENKGVVDSLVKKLKPNLSIAHVESSDIRGIDTSLLYSNKRFRLAPKKKPFGHRISLIYPTRDIFEVPLILKDNDAELTVLVNHWPSRRRGRYDSEPHRIVVANQCGRIVQNLLKFPRTEFLNLPDNQKSLTKLNDRWDRNVLVMGDFNDNPYDRSVLSELKASSGYDKIKEPIKPQNKKTSLPTAEGYLKRQPVLFNCMWQHLGKSDVGTFFWSRDTNTMGMLDQFIISRGLLFGSSGLKLDLDTVCIFKEPSMTTPKGRPKEFEFKTKKKNRNKPNDWTQGTSDHFPITVLIEPT